MRKRIISFLVKHDYLSWMLFFFHRFIGKNKYIHLRNNKVSSTTANVYKNVFEFVRGEHNEVLVGEDSDLHNSHIRIKGNHNRIVIGKSSFINGVEIVIEGDNNSVIIGDNAFILDHARFYVVDGTCLKIGNGCMFSDYVEIRTTDNHSIIDMETDQRVNFEEDVTIMDRVWVGTKVIILKGTHIAQGCIVGAGSLLAKSYNKENTIIAGNPAREIKSGFYWTMERRKK